MGLGYIYIYIYYIYKVKDWPWALGSHLIRKCLFLAQFLFYVFGKSDVVW
ncbi:hypothetical protein ACE6H2_004343 [Prunus campanulata]